MLTLQKYGLELVKRGLTTFFEIGRLLGNDYSPTIVRQLIDIFFSLQWCRDNYVLPLKIQREEFSKKDIIVSSALWCFQQGTFMALGAGQLVLRLTLFEIAFACHVLGKGWL